MGEIAGSQSKAFDPRGRSTVDCTVSFESGGEPFIVEGFTGDDDAIQIRPLEESVTYTAGGAGAISVNLTRKMTGEVIFKILESNDDNARLNTWFNETIAGSIDPATIIITTAKYKHIGYKCLPTKPGEPVPYAEEDSGVEWRFLAAEVKLNQPL